MTKFEQVHAELVKECEILESIAGAIKNSADNDDTGEIHRLADELTNKLSWVLATARKHDNTN